MSRLQACMFSESRNGGQKGLNAEQRYSLYLLGFFEAALAWFINPLMRVRSFVAKHSYSAVWRGSKVSHGV